MAQTRIEPTSAEDLQAQLLAGDSSEVTMRGDLQQMSVSDIFQTLVMSKMEGMLRIRNPLEQHLLFFRNGYVQDVIPHRIENRRLGERLIRAGMIDKEQLRGMLDLQKQTGLPLGQLLVRERLITQEQVEDVANYQAAEDLYSLFTWKDGSFEFFKGPSVDPEHAELLEVLPRFEGTLILLEVARRSDEWDPILEALHSVDEIIVMLRERGDEKLQDNHLLILDSIDGHRTIRELAEVTLLSLFDCARAVRDLHRWGIVGLALPEEILETARSHIDHSKAKRAIAVLRALLQRGEPLPPETVRELASLLHRCGETPMAAQGLLTAAQQSDAPDVALELVREAHRMDPRSVEALGLLLEHLLIAGEEGQELEQVSCALADALTEQGRAEEALEVIAILETSRPDSQPVQTRKARILQKLGRGEEAIEELLRLAERCQGPGQRDRLATVYEQILKIDFRRKDIAKALKSLRTSELHKKLRLAGLVAAGLVLCSSAYWWFSANQAAARREQFVGQVLGFLQAQDTEAARALIEATDDVDEATRSEMRQRLEAMLREEQAEIAREAQNARRARMAQAADHIDHGQLMAGLTIYQELLADAEGREEVEKIVRTRLGSLTRELHELAGELETMVPPAPDPLVQSESDRRAVLTRLRDKFKAEDLRRARGVLQARESALLAELVGARDRDKLVVASERLVTLFHEADDRQREYLALQSRTETEKRLQSTFTAAETYLERNQFPQALAAYRKLAEQYPADNDFRLHFQQQVERLEAILAALSTLEQATKRGDFAAAKGQLKYLRASEPGIPFESLVELPLQVLTVPEGATVRLNGRRVGTTPLLCSYRPAGTKEIALTCDGFRTATVTFEGDERGSAQAILVREPDWTFHAKGSIERAAAVDDQGRAYVVDRSGTVTAVRLEDGLPLWTHVTKDMSGLLPTPVVWGNDVIVASLDGALTSLDRKSAEPSWRCFGVPCEAAPVIADNVLIAATVSAKLIGIDPATGKQIYTQPLPGPVHADLRTDGARVFVTTTNGWLVAIEAVDGKVRWKERIDERIVAAPLFAGECVIAGSDTGRLSCLRTDSGKFVWSRSGLGEILLDFAAGESHVIVPIGQRLRTFEIATGNDGPAFEGDGPWSMPPVVHGDRVLIGNRQGAVLVLGLRDLEIRYQIRGEAQISAPVVIDPSGRVLAGFENHTVLGFRKLP